MKRLLIKRIPSVEGKDLAKLSGYLDEKCEPHLINTVNWPGYKNTPVVKFKIAYSSTELYIKYSVTENFVKAEYTKPNEAVYTDSCVEFFVTPVSDGPYFNFEFNAIGTCLMQSGVSRNAREFGEAELNKSIRKLSSLGTASFSERTGEQSWELVIAIPLEIIFGRTDPVLSGRIIRANFYKCGDGLSQPHYLSWNPISTEQPDFHRPEFFGVLEFE